MSNAIWLVVMRFAPDRADPPTRTQLAHDATLDAFLARASDADLAGWPLRRDLRGSLGARTSASIAFDVTPHLATCIDARDDEVVAAYLFDTNYAEAHPQALDDEHLALLHATVAAKMFDDGAMVLDGNALRSSLQWPRVGERAVRLTRGGGRE